MNEDKAFKKYGVRPLKDEEVRQVFDKKRGAVREIGNKVSDGLVLTTRRLIHLEKSGLRRKARAALLRDIDYLGIEQEGKSYWGYVIASLIMIAGGAGIWYGLTTEAIVAAGGAIGLLFGAVMFIFSSGGGATRLETRIGGQEVEIPVRKSVLSDAEEFIATFFEEKSKATD